MKQKTIAIACAIALLGLGQNNASAQQIHKQPYAYGHTIDVLYGTNSIPYKLDMAENPTTEHAMGGKFDVRYTTYILPWMGAYVQLGVSNAKVLPTDYFTYLNKADNELYQYKERSLKSINLSDEKILAIRYKPHAEFGLAFRYEIYQFSLRSRVGIGSSDYYYSPYSFKKVSRENEDEAPVIYYRSMYRDVKDFILDANESEPKQISTTFLTSSIQLAYTFNKRFYASAEWGFRYNPTKITIREKKYTASNGYNPSTWAEAVYSYEHRTGWNFDFNNPEVSLTTQKIGFSSYLQFGIGFNIGYDHTGKDWFHKYNNK